MYKKDGVMSTIKLKIDDARTLYKMESNNSSHMIFSIRDIKDIINQISENDISVGNINIHIETSIGEYQYRKVENVNFEKLIDEGIQNIVLYAQSDKYDKCVDYIRISVRLSRQFGANVTVESVDEIITRGISSKIKAIIDRNEVSYSGLLKSIQNSEWVCALLMVFSIPLVNLFHDIGVRYRYLYAIFGFATCCYVLTMLNKSGVIHKIKFVCAKTNTKWTYYLNNTNFWQHVVNTIISSVITFLLTTLYGIK